MQALYTGGTVFHAFMPETPERDCQVFIKRACEKYTVPILPLHQLFRSVQIMDIFPVASSNVRNVELILRYTRVVGYYRPVQRWNHGKQEEFKQRQEYVVSNTI